MIIKDFIKNVETAFNKEWAGKRFENYGQLHNEFSKIARMFVPEGLETSTWKFIVWDVGYLEIFDYRFDVTEDKRYKMNPCGTMNSVSIYPSIDFNQDRTIDDLIYQVRINKSLEQIKKMEEWKQRVQDELEKANKALAEVQETNRKLEKGKLIYVHASNHEISDKVIVNQIFKDLRKEDLIDTAQQSVQPKKLNEILSSDDKSHVATLAEHASLAFDHKGNIKKQLILDWSDRKENFESCLVGKRVQEIVESYGYETDWDGTYYHGVVIKPRNL